MTDTYTSVFGGQTVPPADNKYAVVTLTANTAFYWSELATGSNLMADIMDITSSGGAWVLTLPAANVISTGREVLIRNVGSNTLTVKDSAGGTIGTILAGTVKCLYLTSNATAAGVWALFTFGTGTSAADASALAGLGLMVSGAQLAVNAVTTAKSAVYAVVTTDRGGLISFSNSGAIDCTLLTSASAGNGFFVYISNQGTGSVIVTPAVAELIDGAATRTLAPGESLMVVSNSTGWVTVGYGRSTQFQFTKLVLDISTGSPFTLTSVQAANKLLQFTGTLTGNVTVNVPAVVAIYYIQCSWAGAFSCTVKTATGSGVTLPINTRSILYCDGVNVVDAQTSSTPAANLSGGSAGVVVYQTGGGTTGFTGVGTAGQFLLSGGTGVPTWMSNSADNIGATPSGNLAGATVAAQLVELDAEKAALAGSATQAFSVADGTDSQAVNKTQADAAYAALAGSATQAFSVAAATATAHAVRNDQISTGFQDFRLTLTSGLPVTTSDVTGGTTVYMTPYRGNKISLYTSGVWKVYSTAEISFALGTLTAALPYDVFVFDNAGTVTLTAVAWSSATARATALVYQDGVLCKSAATAYRYLGTFYTTSTTTTEDSVTKRDLWNYYHRVDRRMVRQDATGSWTYTTATWRQANAAAANQLEAVQGVAEDMVEMSVFVPVQNTSAGVVMASGIGLDSTTANSALGGGVAPAAAAVVGISIASYEATPAAGWHRYVWLEYSTATGTTTWFSASSVVLFAVMKGRVRA